MTIDHIGSILFPDIMWLRYIGRLSAPIFVFCVTEAMRHTKDQKKYLIKLFGFSLITTFLFYAAMLVNFCMTGIMYPINSNVTGLLFQGALLIYIIEAVRKKKDKWQLQLVLYIIYQLVMRVLYIPIAQHSFGYEIWLEGPLSSIYSGGVLWIALFLVFYYSKEKTAINYIIYCVLVSFVRATVLFAKIGVRLQFYGSKYGLKIISDVYQFVFGGILGLNTTVPVNHSSNCQWLMVFSVIFIMLYNGQYGKGMKKLFYVYYPLHMIVLYFLGLAL
ncbi:MAG: conjugal transfer protein TraX [Alistipes sp.]|nr:conjugal transfer protein TraX [Alistipes sp.]